MTSTEVVRCLDARQGFADKVCDHFGMSRLDICLNRRLGWRTIGQYGETHINLALSEIDDNRTLIHEMAHHLKDHRFKTNAPGYFRIIRARKMVPTGRDDGLYSASGEEEDLKVKVGTIHDHLFRECLHEIERFADRLAGRERARQARDWARRRKEVREMPGCTAVRTQLERVRMSKHVLEDSARSKDKEERVWAEQELKKLPDVVAKLEQELVESERREEMAKAQAKKKAAETKKVEKVEAKKSAAKGFDKMADKAVSKMSADGTLKAIEAVLEKNKGKEMTRKSIVESAGLADKWGTKAEQARNLYFIFKRLLAEKKVTRVSNGHYLIAG
jgi:hypothetical protein